MLKFPTEKDFLDHINPALREMTPYAVVGGQVAEVKLNQNENPNDIPNDLKLDILNTFYKEEWNRYPNLFPQEAIESFANHIGVPKECVMGGNGSNELIYTIFLATLWRGAKVLIPTPNFSLYEKVAGILQAEILKVGMTDELDYDVESILEEAERSRPNLITLTTPNNPTGKSLKFEDTLRIVEESNAIVLIDEAYIEFSRQKSALSLIYDYGNVVILRTFSKAFAAAGLRVGFAISNPDLIAELLKPKIPFASSRLAEITTVKLIERYDLIQSQVNSILEERARMEILLKEIPNTKVFETDANFFVIRVSDPKQVFQLLQSRNILVRDVSSYPMMTGCLRVGIGKKEENERLLNALAEIMPSFSK
ncbi:MAG: histidinol-phosphate transaminase [Chloroherpetonaceae bacterium]|nr:histidinol-phosphate transaminase [Chloroherpetonaceae bacterium]